MTQLFKFKRRSLNLDTLVKRIKRAGLNLSGAARARRAADYKKAQKFLGAACDENEPRACVNLGAICFWRTATY